MHRGITVALALFAFTLSCSEEPAPPPEVVRPVKIFEVGGGGAEVRRDFPGTITSEAEAEVGFEVEGRITDFPVEEGQVVEPGDVLAKLDTRDLQSNLDKAVAKMENSRADFDRSQTLFEQGVEAEAERDRKETALRVTQADVRQARKAVQDGTLIAPVRGTIARKLVRVGESVRAKQSVLVFQADEQGGLEIEVDVPERDIASGIPGRSNEEITAQVQPRVMLAAVPDRPIPARVTEFATSADPDTRTFKVTMSFQAPPDLQILPGMTAKVSVRAPRVSDALQSGVAVPGHAVAADENGQSYVWKIDPQAMEARRAPVELGILAGNLIHVTSGLAVGDWVAESGVHQLREGMKVSRLER